MSDLYTLSEENKILVQDILNDMFNLIISNSEISGYAFKGCNFGIKFINSIER